MFEMDCWPLSLFSTHSVRNCWPLGRLMSTALRPVTSSTSTTPKEYTSAFSVIWPLWAYSGARYLAEETHTYRHYPLLSRFKKNISYPWRFTQMFQSHACPHPCLHPVATLPDQNLRPLEKKFRNQIPKSCNL